MKKIIVAIDGYSSCGKSTLAKGLAKVLHYAYLDSGAMYRAVTLYFIENKIDYLDEKAVDQALSQINIHFERVEGQNHTFLNGKDIEYEIDFSFKEDNGYIIYSKKIVFPNAKISKKNFEKWNNTIKQINKFYQEQITLTKNI